MELGLYLHFPYCISKCPYCDFNSYQLKEDNQISSYISALYQEITAYSQKLKKSNIKTIYLGGGTPTILSGVKIYNILEFCKDKFTIDKNAEITIEANPGTLDGEKINLLIESGVNRLSLGAQSFNNLFLKKLGRIHNTQEIIDSYYLAREAGFNNISIDIMFALPDQITEDLQDTLKKALSLKPDHLSQYKRGKLKLPDEDEEFDMYNWAINYLEENGFEHYEIANFARPHKRSKHNLIYWQNKPYLGIGAGAYSFIRGYRYMNYENPERYIKEVMSGKLHINDIFHKQIKKLVNLGLLQRDDDRIKLTRKGIFLANTVFREFVD